MDKVRKMRKEVKHCMCVEEEDGVGEQEDRTMVKCKNKGERKG